MKKKALALILALCMTALLLPAGALAEGTEPVPSTPQAQWVVAAAGSATVDYTSAATGTLAEAFIAANDDGIQAGNATYIQLLDAVSVTSGFTVNSGKTVVLDLNAKTLTVDSGSSAGNVMENYGILTVKNGTMVCTGSTSSTQYGIYNYSSNDGLLTMDGCTLTVTNAGSGIAVGIYNYSAQSLLMTGCDITVSVTGEARGYVKGIYSYDELSMTNCAVSVNAVYNTNAYGIDADGPVYLNGCNVAANVNTTSTYKDVYGVKCDGGQTLTLSTGNTITATTNSPKGKGYGLDLNSSLKLDGAPVISGSYADIYLNAYSARILMETAMQPTVPYAVDSWVTGTLTTGAGLAGITEQNYSSYFVAAAIDRECYTEGTGDALEVKSRYKNVAYFIVPDDAPLVPEFYFSDGEKVAKPVDPTWTGYEFKGWYADEALTQAFDFTADYSTDVYIYGKFEFAATGASVESKTRYGFYGSTLSELIADTLSKVDITITGANGQEYEGFTTDNWTEKEGEDLSAAQKGDTVTFVGTLTQPAGMEFNDDYGLPVWTGELTVEVPLVLDYVVAGDYITNENSIMAYKYKSNSFDIKGYYDEEWKSTTFNDNGYDTYVRPSDSTSATGISPKPFSQLTQSDAKMGLLVGIDMGFINDGKTLQIKYTVQNTTDADITFDLGTGADVKIGADDHAIIETFQDGSGFKMVSQSTSDVGENGPAQFNFFGMGYQGVDDVSDFWHGKYGTWHLDKDTVAFWGQANNEPTTGDSAAAWHWADQTLSAGETKTLSVVIGIGGEGSENAAAGSGLTEKEGSVELELRQALTGASDFAVTVDNRDGQSARTLTQGVDYTIEGADTTAPTITFEESAGLTCMSDIKVSLTGVTNPVRIPNRIPHTYESFANPDSNTTNAIAASCSIPNCTGVGGRLTLSAPENLVADGTPRPAVVTNNFHASIPAGYISGPTYEKDDNGTWTPMNEVPAEPGTYRATITVAPASNLSSRLRANVPAPVTASVIFTLRAPTTQTWSVTFDANGGTGTMSAQSFNDGETKNLTANAFTKDGYDFMGWNTRPDGSGTGYADGASYTANGSVTLYAQWKVASTTPNQPAPMPWPQPEQNETGKPPVIVTPEQEQTAPATAGGTATMQVTAKNADTYQWYIDRGDGKGFVPIEGETRADYTTSEVKNRHEGYRYRCVASNRYGTDTSPTFILDVVDHVGVPKTGHGANTVLWIGMILLALAGMGVLLTKKERN